VYQCRCWFALASGYDWSSLRSSQRDPASQGYGIPGGIDAGHVFPPVLDQSSLSTEAGSLVPEGEDTKQPPLLCLQDFQQLFLINPAGLNTHESISNSCNPSTHHSRRVPSSYEQNCHPQVCDP